MVLSNFNSLRRQHSHNSRERRADAGFRGHTNCVDMERISRRTISVNQFHVQATSGSPGREPF